MNKLILTLLGVTILATPSCQTTTVKDPFDVMIENQMLKIAELPL